ncbi:uncharacterized protein [Amphiura filiformis]|uniref:uncharacterized protein n=1 Tax=Amphiura filiformis TaxID=82378 RepID=UPI003B21B68D
MHFYCSTCDMLACQVCLIVKHTGRRHKVEGVKETYVKQRDEMQSAIAKTKQHIKEASESVLKLEAIEMAVKKSYDREEMKLAQCVESHMNTLLEQTQLLKKQLGDSKAQKLRSIHERMLNIEEKAQSAARATHAVENLTDYEYIVQHTHLTEQLNEIDLKEHTVPLGFTPNAAAKFVPLNKLDMNVGCMLHVMSDRPREVKLIQTLRGFKEPLCVAHSSTGLLAVCDHDSKKVSIYHELNAKYEKKLNLNLNPSNRNEPYDAAIHPDGRVMVARKSCIEVYSPEGNYLNKIETAAAGTLTKVFSIALSSSGGRIIAGDIDRSVITEHDATGNIVRTLKTNIRPLYATLIHADTHIVMSDWKAGKVSVMDMETGQETLSIDIIEVQGVSYDEQTESLLIARCKPGSVPGKILLKSGVIEQYSYTTGKLVACLEQGLCHPKGITSDANLMVVADKKIINMYKLE